MATPSILPFDGARYMFVGASVTDPFRWPAYFAAYFTLRYPQYQLHFAQDARGGSTIGRMFSNNEFDWDTDANVANNHVHKRTVQPWGADFVFVQHAVSGGYTAANDALHRETYINDYCVPDGMTPVIISGWLEAENFDGGDESLSEQNAISALMVANGYEWNHSKIFQSTVDNWGAETAYTADASTNRLTVVGHTFTDGMRIRLGRTTGNQAVPLYVVQSIPNGGDGENVDYYVRDIVGDTFRLALTVGGTAIDITAAQTGTVQASRKWALRNGHDTGHLGTPGYMAIFKYMMDSLGMDTSVSQTTINASARTVTSQTQCTISGVVANTHGGIDFDRLDNRLPYVLDDDWWADAVELEPALLTHQDYSMQITGLGTGTFDIYCNDVLIGSATGAELEAGWNMAALQVGPVFDKGKEVLGRLRDAQGLVRADHRKNAGLPSTSPVSGFEKYRDTAETSYDVTGNRGSAHVAALAARLAIQNTLDEAVNTEAQPETLAFSIRSTRAWNYVGVPYTDWPYDPFLTPAPTAPAEWPAAQKVGYYYVEPGHVNATNTANGSDTIDANGLRYGYPNRPRLTLPCSSNTGTVYAAGTVVWIKGGEWDTHYGAFYQWQGDWNGTAENPCWIYGDPTTPPVFRGLVIYAGGTKAASHLFVEGIVYDEGDGVYRSAASIQGGANHVVIRNNTIQNRGYDPSEGVHHGSFIAIDGGAVLDTHDIVVYNNTYQNNGGGVDFDVKDADYHGFKINGEWGGGRAYRVWVIGNHVIPGSTPDPIDGFNKSLAGNFGQIGDQSTGTGNVDHVFVAGNQTAGMRQGCVGCKRSGFIIVSSNEVRDILNAVTSQGQAFNTKYDRGENLWFINNFVDNCESPFIRGALSNSGATHLPATASVYVVGNIFKNFTRLPYTTDDASSSNGAWKTRGIALHERRGTVVIANNTVDTAEYIVVTAGNGNDDADSRVHIYNNVGINLGTANDPIGGKAIFVATAGDAEFFFENNLQGSTFSAAYNNTTPINLATFNARADANGNLEGDPLFTDDAADDYTLLVGSPAIGAGVVTSTIEPINVWQTFIDTFTDDPDFPEDPAAVWPRDFAGNERLVNGGIDLGAYAYGSTIPAIPEPDPSPSNVTPPSITGTPIQGTQVTSSAGSWSGAVSYAYQWTRTTGSVVVGTSINYTPVLADVGSTLTFRVTATNATGSTALTTAASAVVEAADVPPPSSSSTGKRSHSHVSRIIAATI